MCRPSTSSGSYTLIKAGAEFRGSPEARRNDPGLTFDIIGPEQAEKVTADIITFLDPVVRELGLHIDDQ